MPKTNKCHDPKASKLLVRRLEREGWYRVKSSGGHLKFKHPKIPGKIIVPLKITYNVQHRIEKQLAHLKTLAKS